MQITQKIVGPQSIVYFKKDKNREFVEKISTERGEEELVNQVHFYKMLPKDIKTLFPVLYDYDIKNKPFRMTMELCDFPTLKEIILYNTNQNKLKESLYNVIQDIFKKIHNLKQTQATENYVKHLYIDRCVNRIIETKKLMKEAKWINKDFCLEGSIVSNPIQTVFEIINNNKGLLIPEYLCTVHGQLGPSHLMLNIQKKNSYKLVDPKGFHEFHDPLLDIIKIGRSFLYGMEWLEDDLYNIKYSFKNEYLTIEDFNLINYDEVYMKNSFKPIMDLAKNNYKNAAFRVYALICCDLIANLPFAYLSGGERRVVALYNLIYSASVDLSQLNEAVNKEKHLYESLSK
ncbi:hypothetical protein [Bacillus nakamurai]|uniref:hypothetical protein n=1 Tax=Bacillus nakamurai TaxID=1793963 RepID=UPI001E2C9E09|nr:hypothetical protein [Bacillus nakamurai]MCC9022354.1 hypothetical protein [Bacillus nakamurai]